MALKFETVSESLPFQALMIKNVKIPLMDGINVLFDKEASKIAKLRGMNNIWKALKTISALPSPTKENTWHPNAHNMIDLRDYVLSCVEGKKGNTYNGLHTIRKWFIENVFNLIIYIYNLDPPWRWIIDSVKDKALKMKWQPRGWNDDWHKWDWYEWWDEQCEVEKK